ncbi:adhesin [Bacillus coahuilensis m2-6]|uniref:metal ABC transporter solute-binding protein, Zn/Mn family n=1 Tax=Bacillus coahuilensis TaxID=408580 RepID=UPI000750383B|nr:zinc ABC transporter substrate-binding protein [Bacillus coahuilensis]KUP09588.1 adhesin [Bacillus coahuilensis m2-6]
MIKKALVPSILSLLVMAAGCQSTTSAPPEINHDNDTIQIYTTLYPLAFFASQIGGKHVEVETIMAPGTDSHTFEPTTKQMIEVAESDLFIYNGYGMEPYADKMSESLQSEEIVLLEATKDLDIDELTGITDEEHAAEDEHSDHEDHAAEDEHSDHEDHATEDEHSDHEDHATEDEHSDHEEDTQHEDEHEGHHHGDVDSHIWIDPNYSLQLAETIKNQLVTMKPEMSGEFEENFETLKTRLVDLDQEFTTLLESKESKELLVSHAAFGYWESRYGIEQIAISGISSTEEPSQKQLADIIKLAQEHDIQYVVFEQNVSAKIGEIIQNEIGAEAAYLHNLSVLTEEDIQNNEDFFTLMEKNLNILDTILK